MGEPVRLVVNDNGTPDDPSDDPYDLLLPQEMLDWLDEQNWVQAHGDWHNVRGWVEECLFSTPDVPCQNAAALTARGLSKHPIQNSDPGEGYEFLVMHRHMIRTIQQAFPKHGEAFRGFYHIPLSKGDPENPLPWIDVRWTDVQREVMDWMENINQHADAFTSEDDYAKWVQFGDSLVPGVGVPGGLPGGGAPPGFPGDGGVQGFPGAGGLDGGIPPGFPGAPPATDDGDKPERPPGSMHTGLHAQWGVPGSSNSLLDNNRNLRNFAFWRLHIWMDEMWERFRRARGIGEDDPFYQETLIAQCEEMHRLAEALPFERDDTPTPPPETGVFATQIAPIFNDHCGGSVCHAGNTPMLGLGLAGAKPSTIRTRLVGRKAREVSMALVEPGKPEQSWLYRKITGNFTDIDCSNDVCTSMPPAGMAPSRQQIDSIGKWIADGATAE